MMKHELDALIKPLTSTEEEFELVESIYMRSEFMSKEDAAKIWKIAFKDRAKKRHDYFNAPVTEDEMIEALNQYHHCNRSGAIRCWNIHFENVRDNSAVICIHSKKNLVGIESRFFVDTLNRYAVQIHD